MRLNRIDLNLFVVFEALYRERRVTKVARHLNITQSGVSNALRRLRETFDDPLFVRGSEGMVPTPVAENMIVDVRQALDLLSRSVGENLRFQPELSEREFRLGMNDLGQALILPGLREKLREQAPKVALSTYYVDRRIGEEDLKSGGLDLLIDAPDINALELDQAFLAELPYVVTMRHGHPLAKGPLSLQCYLGADHIHVSSRKRGRGQVDVALHALGEQRHISMRVQNYLVAANITAESDLLWTVPRMLAETTGLYITEAPLKVPPLFWNLYWPKSVTMDPASRWMRQLIMSQFAESCSRLLPD
ncbi:LysR family transcriptional regulator [Alloalcanivorax xenomutans]|uniref:LysR family transcriptional regulator n=1 Tax=Alloalcanivorax xenomutans TaxID=1094342 RepID=A0A9Q3ZE89_9GAMM|nr:LysR family transcriptional regulator [Alloalcanivorax xenomutans]MCE7508276.1 LysR family transcriptional regulator [Alloalcanivorax xenomutans]WOA30982.1 LysR family transcriptional regulator [Alloalcanivorax xenomutans]